MSDASVGETATELSADVASLLRCDSLEAAPALLGGPGSRISLTLPEQAPDAGRIRRGPRTGVAGPGGDGEAFPWRFWLEGEPTVSPYRPAVTRRSSQG